MSDDEFDKEAEREKLREKYETEQSDRETTERMSQLLPQGATMTDQHCDDCGDPIFRYEGQSFCPTCRAEEGETGAIDRDTEPADSDRTETADTANQDRSQFDATEADRLSTEDDVDSEPGLAPEGPRTDSGAPTPQRLTGDADDPSAALADAVTHLARDAATTDDPRRARDLLAAAREAAEALAALQR